MLKNWKFHSASSILFGNGAIHQLPNLIERFKPKRIVLITDPGIVKAGIANRATEILRDAGIKLVVYDQAVPEPTMASVLTCFSQLEEYQPDLLIALGGGSCIDLCKMISLLLTYGGHPADYFGEAKIPGSIRPIIAIPTTAGTGSEVSPVTIVTDEQTNLKVGISDQSLRPAVALLDPELTVKLPPYITACTGMDALSQAIESYFAIDYRYIEAEGNLIYQGSNPMSDVFAEKAIRLISKNLSTAVHQGSNLAARSNMLLGNLYSALAFTNSGTSLIHALSYPIAEITKKPHGEIIGLLLPYVMEYNMSADVDRFSEIGIFLGERGEGKYNLAKAGIEFVSRLVHDLGMPTRLEMIGIKREHFDLIVEKSLGIDRLIRINPKKPQFEGVKSLLNKAF
ncbi:hydroxyacid-oxoacid transhydrogenase [Fictibacillus enclensis]|uniref:hydroxyacid-oxoacid transhydrogenase n=1 Tax=Fictibacillus enclensis TaxID=1017270 RepID=UPI0025A31025|nr:hydroxyacid-oxoacid transhydrogenase [Fictibacillus enclensis]MDM5201121.1 hydroxyacid-oxoacid transhydrogenase [Fictibacillus enclensis]